VQAKRRRTTSLAWLPFSSPVYFGSMQTKRRRGKLGVACLLFLRRTLPRCSQNDGCDVGASASSAPTYPHPRCRELKCGGARCGCLLVSGVLPTKQAKWRRGELSVSVASARFSCVIRLDVDESHGKRGARRRDQDEFLAIRRLVSLESPQIRHSGI